LRPWSSNRLASVVQSVLAAASVVGAALTSTTELPVAAEALPDAFAGRAGAGFAGGAGLSGFAGGAGLSGFAGGAVLSAFGAFPDVEVDVVVEVTVESVVVAVPASVEPVVLVVGSDVGVARTKTVLTVVVVSLVVPVVLVVLVVLALATPGTRTTPTVIRNTVASRLSMALSIR
jgi:hypothetical protein